MSEEKTFCKRCNRDVEVKNTHCIYGLMLCNKCKEVCNNIACIDCCIYFRLFVQGEENE